MCGIFGVLNANINEYLGDIFQAGNKIRPRGPERTKIIYTDEYFLTFHRLSIMNTSPVFDQPFVYNTKLLSGDDCILISIVNMLRVDEGLVTHRLGLFV